MTAAQDNPGPGIIEKDDLPRSGTARRFEGYLHGGPEVSFFLVDAPPGGGPGLHTHPYAEVFVVQQGKVVLTVGDATLEAEAGQILVVPAGTPHGYVNAGTGRARHVDIHAGDRMVTEWLER
ncbi:MAG TPA: cupin domain-containing protein [Rubrobacter sp.]|nr:cupin domain-containing protein [Rubrobacter sp.]